MAEREGVDADRVEVPGRQSAHGRCGVFRPHPIRPVDVDSDRSECVPLRIFQHATSSNAEALGRVVFTSARRNQNRCGNTQQPKNPSSHQPLRIHRPRTERGRNGDGVIVQSLHRDNDLELSGPRVGERAVQPASDRRLPVMSRDYKALIIFPGRRALTRKVRLPALCSSASRRSTVEPGSHLRSVLFEAPFLAHRDAGALRARPIFRAAPWLRGELGFGPVAPAPEVAAPRSQVSLDPLL